MRFQHSFDQTYFCLYVMINKKKYIGMGAIPFGCNTVFTISWTHFTWKSKRKIQRDIMSILTDNLVQKS